MEEHNNSRVSRNKAIITACKGKYPALDEAIIKDETLLLANGLEIDLNTVSLKKIPENNFNMSPTNLYIYLSNHFYKHNPRDYENEIEEVLKRFTDLRLNEADIILLQKFAYDFWLRLQLFHTEPALEKDEGFMQELLKRRNVITASLQSPSQAASVISNTYNQNLRNAIAESEANLNSTNNNNNYDTQEAQGKGNAKGISLARNKPGLPSTIENPDDSRLGIAGFASVVLIVALTIAFGAYLATTLFTK